MATNITKEDNLIKASRHTTILQYDVNKPDDLLSKSYLDLVVVFKDKDGEYPDGKVVRSDEVTVKFDYTYHKDPNGNIVSCDVKKSVIKNGQQTDYEKVDVTSFYDEKGRVVEKRYTNRDGICFNKEKFWYYHNGVMQRHTVKSTHTIKTTEYNTAGNVVLVWSRTIKSGATQKHYNATYDDRGRLIHYIDFDKKINVTVERDEDHDCNVLSETEIFRRTTDNKIISKATKVYDPNNEYKISQVIKNGFVTEQYWYNLKGELIQMVIKEDEKEVMTRIQRTVDPETNHTIKETHKYVTCANGHQHIKYTREEFDEDGNLLVFSEDNSKVTEYTYEDGKRMTATTKQLIDGEFKVIDEITYTYPSDDEKVRTEVRYDKDGNMRHKQTHTEAELPLQKNYSVENRDYEVPEVVPPDTDPTP